MGSRQARGKSMAGWQGPRCWQCLSSSGPLPQLRTRQRSRRVSGVSTCSPPRHAVAAGSRQLPLWHAGRCGAAMLAAAGISLPAARSPPKLSAKKDTPHKTHLPGGKGDDRGGAGASASGRGSAASPLPTVLTVHKNPLLRQGLTKRSMVLSTKKETPHKAHLLGGEGGAGAAAGGSGSSASPLPTVHKNPLLLQGLPKKYMVLEDMFGEFATSSRPCSSPFLCMRSHTWRTASQVAAR